MLRLTRTGIRNIACDDAVYARGLHYYKKNRVSNAAFSKITNQYKIQVMGSYQYQVLITEQKDGTIDFSCNCPAHVKYSGACKHVVAALLFILKYQEKSLMEEPQTTEEKRACQVLDYFNNQEDTYIYGEVYKIKAIIFIPYVIRENEYEDNVILNLYVGNNRMYKVQGVKKFLQDMTDKVNIFLGKEFAFIHGESEFDRSSMQLLDYLMDILEISKAYENASNTPIMIKSNVNLSKRMLIKLLNILGRNKFDLILYGKKYESINFLTGNPYVHYDLDVFDDALVFNDFDRVSVIPISENGELIYYDRCIYQPDKRFIRNFLPFFNVFKGDNDSIIFRGSNMNKFLEEVLPKLHDTMDVTIPESLKSRYLSIDMKPLIYFDKHFRDIKAELKFKYGDYSFNCFEEPKTGSYILIRQKDKEEQIMHMLEELDFEPLSTFYLLKNDKSIYDFLLDKMNILADQCELYYSEDFKSMSIHSEGRFKVGISLSRDIDFMEVDLDYDNIPKEELSELFRAYKFKKKYYRLKNGSFVNLNSDAISSMAEIFDNINYKPSNMTGNSIKLRRSSIFYLNDALSNDSFEVNKDDALNIYMDRILKPFDNDYVLPKNINAQLHMYQATGYRWLSTLADYNLGGILADDMGLGKTLQAIVYIASRITHDRRFLIVCPSSLIYNWLDEFENFAPFINTVSANGTPIDRKAIIENENDYQVLITSYPLIRRDLQYFQKIHFDTVFIDEAQFIKNASSLNAHSVKALNAEHRFALTGTPIENSLSELWSIFDFIMPSYLMSHSKFIENFEKKIAVNDSDALENLNKRIQPFILRRLKKDVLLELPDKTEEKILTDMTDEQKKIYMTYIGSIRKEFVNASGEIDYQSQQLKFLSAVMRLRQICCHPSTFLNGYEGGSGKLQLLMQLINDGIAGSHRILVFSQFTSMLKLIEDELIKDNISYYYLEGATPIIDRNEYVKSFNDGNRSVFLISLKAGGTGLNLTGADMVIHYDPWWNPAVEEQAADRAYRIGQEKNVHVIKLIAKGTIEEKIFKLQKKKKELSDSVIQSKEVFINLLTKEELKDLLR